MLFEDKKKTSEQTKIEFLLDRSYSMVSIKEAMEKAINDLLEQQIKDGFDVVISCHNFDEKFETVINDVHVSSYPKIVIEPRGGTALYDAVAKWSAIKDKKEYKNRLLVIVTDGEENSSVEATSEDVKKIIGETKNDGWDVIFMGANQDAITEASKIGISMDKAIKFGTSSGEIASASNVMYSYTSSLRDFGISGACFDAQMRSAVDSKWSKNEDPSKQ